MPAPNLACNGNRDFLDAIFTGRRADEFLWTAQFKTPPNQAKSEQWAGLPVSEAYENTPSAHVGWNHYFCVATLKADPKGERHRRKANFSRLYCIVLDDAKPIIDIEPTWVLETSLKADGSPNTQVGYRLSTPIEDVDLAVRLHQALSNAGHLGADKNGNNPVRYVRLPWGWNTKSTPPHAHRLLYWSPETSIDLDTLISAFQLDLSITTGGAVVSAPIGPAIDPSNEAEWKPKARKLAWDGALRTHNDPKLGRNSEINRLGAYAARDRLPEAALEFILQEFAARMRPTNTSGEPAPINWANERAAIRRGYIQGHADGVPALVDLSAFQPKAILGADQIQGQPAPVMAHRAAPQPAPRQSVPSALLTIPGALGFGVEWMLDNAKKPQPIYAVQAMLALGATVLGRRFCTDHQNWPSLFLPVLGLSATGKESIKQSIEQILTASGLESLIGPNKYTSDSGLMSSLIHQPSHICVSDEFGKILESASDPNNTGARSTLRMMMEVWGRCDGVLRPTGYATAGLKQDAIDALNARIVYKPALTFVGLATPDSFYEALTSGSLIDGFINRMLIVECMDERKPSVFRRQTPPPEPLISWCKSAAPTGFIVKGEFQSIDNAANREPSGVTVIPFSRESMAQIIDFDTYCIERMNALQSDGLAEMYGRTNEIAMRVSLIVAVSCGASTIAPEHVEWAIQYVSYWTGETVHQARTRVADGACDAAMKDVERLLVRAGDAGLSMREIRQRSRRFAKLAPRVQFEVMAMLKQEHMIDQRRVVTSTKPKDVWVYVGDG